MEPPPRPPSPRAGCCRPCSDLFTALHFSSGAPSPGSGSFSLRPASCTAPNPHRCPGQLFVMAAIRVQQPSPSHRRRGRAWRPAQMVDVSGSMAVLQPHLQAGSSACWPLSRWAAAPCPYLRIYPLSRGVGGASACAQIDYLCASQGPPKWCCGLAEEHEYGNPVAKRVPLRHQKSGKRGEEGVQKDKSYKPGLNLSGSWQRNHSTAYNTQFELSRLQRIYPKEG